MANLQEIKCICEAKLSYLQPWPNYFRRRHLEFRQIIKLFPISKNDKVLELGCGIGFNSALLAQITKDVTATDLNEANQKSHTPGLDNARTLIHKLSIDNVDIKSASADSLPFSDNSFNLVFSSYMMQYVHNKTKAINEINRVLIPGGLHVCIVPSSMDRFYTFFYYQIYLFKALIKRIFRKKTSTTDLSIPIDHVKPVPTFVSFPFPPSDAGFKNYWGELLERTPKKWRKLLTTHKNNLIGYSTTILFPFPFFDALFPKLSLFIYSFTGAIETKLGKLPIFRWLGINQVIITRKK